MKYLLKSYLTPKSKFHQGVFVMMNSILTRAVFFILLGMLGIVVYQTLCKNDDINSREERLTFATLSLSMKKDTTTPSPLISLLTTYLDRSLLSSGKRPFYGAARACEERNQVPKRLHMEEMGS